MSLPRPPAQPSRRGAWLLRLGSVVGVPIFVTPSWLVVAGFITISYAHFLRVQVAGLTLAGSYLVALVYVIALGASVLAHEIGHTLVSRAVGLPVRRIVVFLLGGVSEVEGETTRPRDEFVIAAAGPAISFLLAGGCWAAGLMVGAGSSLDVVLRLLTATNLIIVLFNVLPGLPLDGGRLLLAVVWRLGQSRAAGVRVAAWSGRGIALLLGLSIVAVNVLLTRDGPITLSTIATNALAFAVAGFLWVGASQTLRTADVARRARGLHVRHLIRPTIYLPPNTPISEALRRAVEARAAGIVVIDPAGLSRAIVREADVAGIHPARRPWATLADVSRTLEPGLVIDDTLAGEALLAAVRAKPASEYLVVDRHGTSCGVIATADLVRALDSAPPRTRG